MGKATKVLRGCLLAGGFFVLSSALLIALYIAWSMHANQSAEAAARALCAGIRVGDRIEPLVAKAEAGEPKPRVARGDDETHFVYQGMIFYARECRVSTVQGRVTATRVILHDDD